MRRFPEFLAAVLLAGLLPSLATPAHAAEPDDDGTCRRLGFRADTAPYFECRAELLRGRRNAAPTPAAPENLSDGMALSQCEIRARKVAPYPIKRLASSFVFPGTRKRASLSFAVTKPGSSIAFWNAECKFEGGRMIDFSAH